MNSVFLIAIPNGTEWILALCALLILLIPIICIIDILRSDFRHPNAKLIWGAIIIFLPIVGSVLYYWIGTEQKAISRR